MAGESVVSVPTHTNQFPLRERSSSDLLIPETGFWPWKEEAGLDCHAQLKLLNLEYIFPITDFAAQKYTSSEITGCFPFLFEG